MDTNKIKDYAVSIMHRHMKKGRLDYPELRAKVIEHFGLSLEVFDKSELDEQLKSHLHFAAVFTEVFGR